MDTEYENLIDILYNEIGYYVDVHGDYDGFVSTKNNIVAYLVIENIRKLYWFKRIRIKDDRRPPTVNYYPRLAPMDLDEEFVPHNNINNNNNNNNNNDNDEDDDTDEVSTDDEVSDNDYDPEMAELFLQNWIAADENESGYSYEMDDDDDDVDMMM
ncbi:hypothetical protein PV327_011502 [Microctonus hyperodae]|uniref:Uncharacterized protein n=1 Tax=Microctonus hyperodae TaxID=165561 RepID=A0AA39C2W2_MICHY|nr:hypothetical protein PV327_011502 [Microctonus hyperodae]